jgi:hypothetical protein
MSGVSHLEQWQGCRIHCAVQATDLHDSAAGGGGASHHGVAKLLEGELRRGICWVCHTLSRESGGPRHTRRSMALDLVEGRRYHVVRV